MKCAWQAYLNLLPQWMRATVDRQGRSSLQELRLRLNAPPELITATGSVWMEKKVTREDLSYTVNTACRYSPWTAATAASGYITAPGGHRLGICGEAIQKEGEMTGIGSPTSLCMRVARDFPGIAGKAASICGSVLLLGRPGSGKTTLLRDLIRQKAENENVAVVDERREVFPAFQGECCFFPGKKTDVLSGCGKAQGIDAVLRCMSPDWIAMDEITAEEDCQALQRAGRCGVKLMATAHAGCLEDLHQRPIYRMLIASKLFDCVIVLQPDKSWSLERL